MSNEASTSYGPQQNQNIKESMIVQTIDRNSLPTQGERERPEGVFLVGRAPVSAFQQPGVDPNEPMHGEDSRITRLIVNPGEDVAQKISEFAHSAPRATSVLSGSGVIASATIREYGCTTTTYEGPLDILSLTGTYLPKPGNYESRTQNLVIVLGGKEGDAFGGRVFGSLIAATIVQVKVRKF